MAINRTGNNNRAGGNLTTKGDISVYSNTPTRLPVGADGTTLVANSASASGLGWTNLYGQNFIINGNFDIWQRGTTFTSPISNSYTADRWACAYAVNNTITQQTTGVPIGATYCIRMAYTGANAISQMSTALEAGMVKMLAGRTVTVSVKLRKNATFAAGIDLVLQKNATANTLSGGTWSNIANATVANASLPTGTTSADWYSLSLTATVPNDGTANGLRVSVNDQVLGASGQYWEMSEVKLEIGSVVTPMTISGGTLQGELQACQRYYTRLNYQGSGSCTFGGGLVGTTTIAQMYIPLPVSMRTGSILVLDYSNVRANDYNNAYTVSSIAAAGAYSGGNGQLVQIASTGLTQYRPINLDTNSAGYLGFSQEL